VTVEAMTRGKIVEHRFAPVLPGYNVLKVKRLKRWQPIRKAARNSSRSDVVDIQISDR